MLLHCLKGLALMVKSVSIASEWSQLGTAPRREDLLPDDIDDPELLLRALVGNPWKPSEYLSDLHSSAIGQGSKVSI